MTRSELKDFATGRRSHFGNSSVAKEGAGRAPILIGMQAVPLS